MLTAESVGLGVPRDYGENYERLRLVFEIKLNNPTQYMVVLNNEHFEPKRLLQALAVNRDSKFVLGAVVK
jgi:hypothetical protein